MSTRDGAAPRIDLNADVGEGCDDAAMVPLVTSANVSCGAHAGDDDVIRGTLRVARAHAVAVGAHPSFPDRAGFGRRITTRDPRAIADLVAAQIAHLAGLASAEGVVLAHVKPHGALYNLAAAERDVADAVARGVARELPGTRLVLLAGCPGLPAARDAGLVPVAEAFVDRTYLDDGSLVPRDRPGAVIEDVGVAARQALALARGEPIASLDGRTLHVAADTLCLHGDSPGAALRARAVRDALARAGVRVAPVGAT
jgi:UPF0271 protein